MTYHLERTILIPRPWEEVFAFFADAGNLEAITPKSLRVHIVTAQHFSMRAGTVIDYSLRLFGLPFHWRTLIKFFDPVSSFVDVQLSGPYGLWRHHHYFTETSGGTIMRDYVLYEMPFGLLGSIAHALFVRRSLNRIFNHRNSAILKLFGR